MSFLKKLDHLRIPFGDIEVATNNFTTIIGEGGYGPVYEGKLILSGNLTRVAVKRPRDRSDQGFKEFLTEISLLSRYKHPNLVTLLGFCHEGHENILIYEYAEHGSFDNYLNKANPLTWRQRLHICVDAARGLDYLHNRVGADHRIIHRDIKSGNILLDGNFRAMIADFGLSKIGRANAEATFLITNVGGTLSYVDPVYMDTGVLTKKSDVYSFGVVLFEALCARLCFMDVIGEHRNLVRFARRCYQQGKLHLIMDPDLKDAESIKEFSSIAYQCLHYEQEARPSMDVVLEKLVKALAAHELEEAYDLQEYVEALILQEVLEAMKMQVVEELEETSKLQEFVEALVLQEVLEGVKVREFEEACKLKEFEEACKLKELKEALRLQKYEEACEIQLLEEALGLQILVRTLQVQAGVEAFIMQELDAALEMPELVVALELHKLGEILKLETDYGTIKAIHMMPDSRRPTYTTKEEIYTNFASGILLDDAKVWFSIDENGNNQEMISARKFLHPKPNRRKQLSWLSFEDDSTCRFPMAAQIRCGDHMQVKIRPQFLSSNVPYAAYLVCKHVPFTSETPTDAILLEYILENGKLCTSHAQYSYEHDWVMIELFRTNSFERNNEFKLSLLYFSFFLRSTWMSEVIIQGIVFMPIQKFDDEIIKTKEMENPLTFEKGWEKNRLPSDYEHFLYYSGKKMENESKDYIVTETKAEAYAIYDAGLYIKREDGADEDFSEYFTLKTKQEAYTILSKGVYRKRDYDGLWVSPTYHVITETIEEAYAILSRGVYITLEDDTDVWFWITKSDGKKCFMVSAESIMEKKDNLLSWELSIMEEIGSEWSTMKEIHSLLRREKKLKLTRPNESRFKYVLKAQLNGNEHLEFRIATGLLSAKTSYACYLVYKMPQLASCFLVDVKAVRNYLGLPNLTSRHDIHYDGQMLLSGLGSPIIGSDGAHKSPTSSTHINKLPLTHACAPSKRKDGWLEAKLWDFTTHDRWSIQSVCPMWRYGSCYPDRFTFFHTGYGQKISITLTSKHCELVEVQGVEFRPI